MVKTIQAIELDGCDLEEIDSAERDRTKFTSKVKDSRNTVYLLLFFILGVCAHRKNLDSPLLRKQQNTRLHS